MLRPYLRKEILRIVTTGGYQLSLLDVGGGCLGVDRLQLIAEKVLPESQCGFCKRRGCVDMIFTARQLFEKSRELFIRTIC